MLKRKIWLGSDPEKCDVCGDDLRFSFVDGKIRSGPWGILCLKCHSRVGCGLGMGMGQKYTLEAESGEWVKVMG